MQAIILLNALVHLESLSLLIHSLASFLGDDIWKLTNQSCFKDANFTIFYNSIAIGGALDAFGGPCLPMYWFGVCAAIVFRI